VTINGHTYRSTVAPLGGVFMLPVRAEVREAAGVAAGDEVEAEFELNTVANDVLAHLRSCADVWGGCIELIIAQDMPTIRAVNPRTWIDDTDYFEQAFQPSLDAFVAQRTYLLAVLEPLAPEVWSRAAKVTGAGKPLVRTVHSCAEWLALHERPHVKQIERIVNTMRM